MVMTPILTVAMALLVLGVITALISFAIERRQERRRRH